VSDAAEKSRTRRARGLLSSLVIDRRPLRVPAYRRLWTSTIVTAIGSQFTAVAVPKQVYDLTHSSGFVGLTGAVALVPLLVFGLWGGAIADTVDRRTVLLVSNAGIALTSAMLWLQAFLGLGSVWVVLVLLGVQQAFFAVNMPTRTAAISRLVPPELLPSAIALGSTVAQFGMVLGPLLAGTLLPVAGLSTLYLVDALALGVTMWAVWRLPPIPPLSGPQRRAGLRDVLDGFRYLAMQKVLLVSFLADIIAMVAGMPRALFPEMAERTFGDPPGGGFALGALYAAVPVGALLCGISSGWLSRVRRHGVAVIVSVCVWGVAMAGFGLSPMLWLAVVFLAIGGAADMTSMVYRSAMLQEAATDEMRGRMQGVFTVVVAGGPRIADVVHGWTAAAAGTAAAAAGGGFLVVAGMIVLAVCVPVFWRYVAPSAAEPPAVTATDEPARPAAEPVDHP
jgi:MFS family permease